MFTKKRVVIGITLLVGCAVLLVIGTVIHNLGQPASGAITLAPVSSTTTSAIDMTPQPQTGQKVSFSYPAALTFAKNSPFNLPTVEEFNYTYRDIESWNLAIAVLFIPSQHLNDNNAYLTRKETPTKYKESQQTIQGQPVIIMTDTSVGGFSKIAFLMHGNYQATVSLLGDDPSGDAPLQQTLNLVLNSWHWKVS